MTFLDSRTGSPLLCLNNFADDMSGEPANLDAYQSSGFPFVNLISSVAVDPSMFFARVESCRPGN